MIEHQNSDLVNVKQYSMPQNNSLQMIIKPHKKGQSFVINDDDIKTMNTDALLLFSYTKTYRESKKVVQDSNITRYL